TAPADLLVCGGRSVCLVDRKREGGSRNRYSSDGRRGALPCGPAGPDPAGSSISRRSQEGGAILHAAAACKTQSWASPRLRVPRKLAGASRGSDRIGIALTKPYGENAAG